MTREKRRLGQGLAALLGNSFGKEQEETPEPEDNTLRIYPEGASNQPAPTQPNSDATPELIADGNSKPVDENVRLNVYEIDNNPFQPRREFTEPEIASLSESLKEHDILQPVLVRKVGDRYQLISGERRLRAAIQAGWSTIPARIREANDRLVAELAIVENLQRQDLNPIEKALSFRRYLDEHQCPQEDLAKRLKIDRSTIANLVRLLELPDEVQQLLAKNALTAGHARALLPLGDEIQQVSFAQKIIEDSMSVRATETLVSETIQSEDGESVANDETPAQKAKRTRSQQVASLEQEFRMALGTKVDIKSSAKGRGRIVLHFANHDEFERLREYLIDSDDQFSSEVA